MDIIVEGFSEALRLIISVDGEVFEVVRTSLYVTFVSLVIAGAAGIPAGLLTAGHEFRLKGLLTRVIYTLMGMPPVLCGLVVYVVFMRRGPLGSLSLNYTITVMVIAQILLIFPIIMGITSAQQRAAGDVRRLARTLGAGNGRLVSPAF